MLEICNQICFVFSALAVLATMLNMITDAFWIKKTFKYKKLAHVKNLISVLLIMAAISYVPIIMYQVSMGISCVKSVLILIVLLLYSAITKKNVKKNNSEYVKKNRE